MKLGKLSENALKRSVLRQIKSKNNKVVSGAGVGEDCAIFSFSEADFVMSCVREEVLRSPKTIGNVIQKCANNLATAGAALQAVLMVLILPEETQEADLKMWMEEADAKCKELSAQIAGGQTTVSTAVKSPVAVVTGFGVPFEPLKEELPKGVTYKATPGQDIVISKWIGLEGTAILAAEYREDLATRYPAYMINEAAAFDRFLDVIPEAATAVKSGVRVMHDVSEGGILGALWEFAEKSGVGLTIDLKKLPLRQETVEVCEFCEVNPYELLSGGSMIFACDDGENLVEALAQKEIPAVIVGKVTEGPGRIVTNEDEVRYLDKPKQDAIYTKVQIK